MATSGKAIDQESGTLRQYSWKWPTYILLSYINRLLHARDRNKY